MSFYSCPPPKSNIISDLRPFIDYDVILCAKQNGPNSNLECYAASQSIDGTDEGFQVVVPSQYLGSGYSHGVYAVKSADANSPCPGHQREPYVVSVDIFEVDPSLLPSP